MSEFVQIATTTGTRELAERIAVELVSRRLAACVQVSGPIHSTFRWQGSVETAEEWMCAAKTVESRIADVERLVKELHAYDVPEIIVTPIVGGSAAYLHWLTEQVDSP
jgi:periplasmic divalent cation tolerance protein